MVANGISRCVNSIFRKGLFDGKVAIVTGGGTGIGRAISLELLHLGCKVVIASRNEDRLQQAATEMRSNYSISDANVAAIKCNIRDENQVATLVSRTLETYGQIDYLVNNGGGQFQSTIADTSLKGWNAVIETNLTGTFLMSKQVYNSWMKEHGGAIVNILLVQSRGSPLTAHSGAARAGVENLTKSLAIEWASNGIRVNGITPGSVYSPTAAASYGFNVFEGRDKNLPVKRLGKPEEVSAAVAFMLSPAASLITGATLLVDGGQDIYSPLNFVIPDHNRLPAYTWENNDEQESNETKNLDETD